jgi:hypothetical protein
LTAVFLWDGLSTKSVAQGRDGLKEMSENRSRARTKHELILDVWKQLQRESVGAQELETIQQAILEVFGEGATESPASIARTLADTGATLRHPEILDSDARWREGLSLEMLFPEQLNFSNLTAASDSIGKLDDLRKKFEQEGDQAGLQRLRGLALEVKREVQVVARSRAAGRRERLEAKETAEWLIIWLQDPHIFADWLSLRRRSPEFIEMMGSDLPK